MKGPVMLITTPAAAAAAARAEHRFTVPNLRPALLKAADYAMALHYRYVRARIEGELRGVRRMLRGREIPF